MKKLLLTLSLVLASFAAQGQNNEIPTYAPDKESDFDLLFVGGTIRPNTAAHASTNGGNQFQDVLIIVKRNVHAS